MALQHSRLADIQYVPNAAGSILTNAAATKTYIRGITLFNGNTTTETVKLYLVPDAAGALGTAGAANQFAEISLATKETLFVEVPASGYILQDTNDSLQAVTTTASKVTVILVGDKDV